MEIHIDFKYAFTHSNILEDMSDIKHLIHQILELVTYKLVVREVDFYIEGNHYIFLDEELDILWVIMHETLNYLYGSEINIDDFLDFILLSK